MNVQTVAQHEAGHAVAAWHLGHTIDRVTILPGEDFAGRCIATPAYGKHFAPDAHVEPEQFLKMLEDIDVCLAGHEAEAAFTGRNNWVGSRVDYGIASDLASYLCDAFEEVSALLKWRRVRARALVVAHSAEIEAVAKVLLERTTLTGDEVRHAANVARFGQERVAALIAGLRN